MKELSIEQKAKAYDNLIERLKDFQFEYRFSAFSDTIESYFPELAESEDESDERIRKDIVFYIAANHKDDGEKARWLYWLEKQGKKTNPYSGTSFEYNGHIWGMCARDNGVDILLDKQLFKHLEKQSV